MKTNSATKIISAMTVVLCLEALAGFGAEDKLAVRRDANEGMGISSWAGWWPGQISKAESPDLRSVPLIVNWNKLEPAPGEYPFEKYVGEPLKAAAADGLPVTLMIWVGPACPDWIYQQGVPVVTTDQSVNPLGQKVDIKYPYYLSPEYKKRFLTLIGAFGGYLHSLSPQLQKRILFVQSAEGSTGDGQPYKGNPVNRQYDISPSTWNDFRRETWAAYRKAVPHQIPILVNGDANSAEETEWLLKHMDVIALKEGMFSHGYVVSDSTKRLQEFRALEAEARKSGNPVLTRGEMDGELYVMGWEKRNVPQALYWSGIFATHCGLDIWNIPVKALRDKANWPAFAFFNKYAGQTDPARATAAFCALHEGLDVADFKRFPANEFGGKPGQRRNLKRYLKIAAAYAQYGALETDPQKAAGPGMINRKSSGPNDAGWGIIAGNYCRFLTQINPGSGDVGRWNVDDSIYGRFARAFEHESGKTQMRFELDKAFQGRSASVKVTYLDRGNGEWSLQWGNAKPIQVTNTGSGLWKTVTGHVSGFALGGSILVLRYEKGSDTVFHMVEVDRVD